MPKHGRDTLNDFVAIREENFNKFANMISYVHRELRTYMDCRGVQTDTWLTNLVFALEDAEESLYDETFKFENGVVLECKD